MLQMVFKLKNVVFRNPATTGQVNLAKKAFCTLGLAIKPNQICGVEGERGEEVEKSGVTGTRRCTLLPSILK